MGSHCVLFVLTIFMLGVNGEVMIENVLGSQDMTAETTTPDLNDVNITTYISSTFSPLENRKLLKTITHFDENHENLSREETIEKDKNIFIEKERAAGRSPPTFKLFNNTLLINRQNATNIEVNYDTAHQDEDETDSTTPENAKLRSVHQKLGKNQKRKGKKTKSGLLDTLLQNIEQTITSYKKKEATKTVEYDPLKNVIEKVVFEKNILKNTLNLLKELILGKYDNVTTDQFIQTKLDTFENKTGETISKYFKEYDDSMKDILSENLKRHNSDLVEFIEKRFGNHLHEIEKVIDDKVKEHDEKSNAVLDEKLDELNQNMNLTLRKKLKNHEKQTKKTVTKIFKALMKIHQSSLIHSIEERVDKTNQFIDDHMNERKSELKKNYKKVLENSNTIKDLINRIFITYKLLNENYTKEHLTNDTKNLEKIIHKAIDDSEDKNHDMIEKRLMSYSNETSKIIGENSQSIRNKIDKVQKAIQDHEKYHHLLLNGTNRPSNFNIDRPGNSNQMLTPENALDQLNVGNFNKKLQPIMDALIAKEANKKIKNMGKKTMQPIVYPIHVQNVPYLQKQKLEKMNLGSLSKYQPTGFMNQQSVNGNLQQFLYNLLQKQKETVQAIPKQWPFKYWKNGKNSKKNVKTRTAIQNGSEDVTAGKKKIYEDSDIDTLNNLKNFLKSVKTAQTSSESELQTYLNLYNFLKQEKNKRENKSLKEENVNDTKGNEKLLRSVKMAKKEIKNQKLTTPRSKSNDFYVPIDIVLEYLKKSRNNIEDSNLNHFQDFIHTLKNKVVYHPSTGGDKAANE